MEAVQRLLRLLKRNAFLFALYMMFFWLRLLDLATGDHVSDQLVWTVLWLTPVVYMEPALKRALVTDYWMERESLWAFEAFILAFMVAYMCFIKFVIYGQLLGGLEVLLLAATMALYHAIEMIRKLPEPDFAITVLGISFFFAAMLKALVVLI
ncbi:MAG: hypothetical protein DRJ67_12145 [Thermoprotei archaeon]|nr:MAG: hypothetical protein DRJ67_12145 [Thermoprotei archaeon]